MRQNAVVPSAGEIPVAGGLAKGSSASTAADRYTARGACVVPASWAGRNANPSISPMTSPLSVSNVMSNVANLVEASPPPPRRMWLKNTRGRGR